jgi:hypothetical protein
MGLVHPSSPSPNSSPPAPISPPKGPVSPSCVSFFKANIGCSRDFLATQALMSLKGEAQLGKEFISSFALFILFIQQIILQMLSHSLGLKT